MRVRKLIGAAILSASLLLTGCLLPPAATPDKDGEETLKENESDKGHEPEYVTLNATVAPALGDADATIVIVHDDGTKSTVEYMVDSFKENGLVGTLGLITKNLATKSADGEWVLKDAEVEYWQSILDTGVFNVASHSHTHTFWGVSDEAESGWYLDASNNLHEYSFEAGRITEEVAVSKQILKAAFPDQRVLSFIKPGFGRVSDENGTKGMTQISDKAFEIIGEHYVGMRNTGGDVDTMPFANTYSVKSHTVKNTDTATDWKSLTQSAQRTGGVLVFLFHHIENSPTNSLRADIDQTDIYFKWLGIEKEAGRVWNPYLEDAMLYSEEMRTAKIDARLYEDRITVDLTDDMDDAIYDHPLTLRIPIPAGYDSVTYDGKVIFPIVKDGTPCVLIDLIPDSDTVTLWLK